MEQQQQHTPPGSNGSNGSDSGVSAGTSARAVFDRVLEIESPADRLWVYTRAWLRRELGFGVES